MAKTRKKEGIWGGFYERMREFLVDKTALFGIIRWTEVVHTEKADDDLILDIVVTKMPDKTYVNGKEYQLIPLSKTNPNI